MQVGPQVRIVLVHENRLTAEATDEQSAALLRLGWQSVWEPAELTDKEGLSAGVAILVRACHGIRLSQVVYPHRALKATIDLTGNHTIEVISVYGFDGEGLSGRQVNLLKAIGEQAQDSDAAGTGIIIGGDWNLTSRQLASTEAIQRMKATMATGKGPTCTQPRCKGKIIDFFVVARRLASAIQSTQVWQQADMAPHRPVCLEMDKGWLEVTTTKLVTSPKLPRERAIGPARKEPCYLQARWLALKARELAAHSGSKREVDKAYDRRSNYGASWQHRKLCRSHMSNMRKGETSNDTGMCHSSSTERWCPGNRKPRHQQS